MKLRKSLFKFAALLIVLCVTTFTSTPTDMAQDAVQPEKHDSVLKIFLGRGIVRGQPKAIQELKRLGLNQQQIQQIRRDLRQRMRSSLDKNSVQEFTKPSVINNYSCVCNIGQWATAVSTVSWGVYNSEWNWLLGGNNFIGYCDDETFGCLLYHETNPGPTNKTVSHDADGQYWVGIHTAWCL